MPTTALIGGVADDVSIVSIRASQKLLWNRSAKADCVDHEKSGAPARF